MDWQSRQETLAGIRSFRDPRQTVCEESRENIDHSCWKNSSMMGKPRLVAKLRGWGAAKPPGLQPISFPRRWFRRSLSGGVFLGIEVFSQSQGRSFPKPGRSFPKLLELTCFPRAVFPKSKWCFPKLLELTLFSHEVPSQTSGIELFSQRCFLGKQLFSQSQRCFPKVKLRSHGFLLWEGSCFPKLRAVFPK